MFLFRAACSSVALLALLVAAPFLRADRAAPVPPEVRPAALDATTPRAITPSLSDCPSVWRPPYPFSSSP